MSRQKRSSAALDKAERRVAGLRSIDTQLDLGNSLTLDSFTTAVDKARSKLETYNTLLSTVDAAYNELLEAEKSLGSLTEHMLLGVASKYGKDSHEYEMAGGVRKSERKRPARKAKTPTVA